eukprot:CAMPEP_0174919374 /NCGR_PEP_ID=MMETSP1355-20121228/3626_1 /TAXON_ID=464990 /ORGANISM="Hemiselmis tepida, Strain CCMP443" /LENGTH=467 /DNA_ID=CAMNT_0016164595 /DNA_START=133 /DNA_END=1533 /DNA_ORIENTATION=+
MEGFKGQVAVFSITGCPHCKAAKALLKELGAPYVEVDLSGRKDFRLWLVNKTGKRTAPQIFFNDLHVGGSTELLDLHKEGKLAGMLEEVKSTPIPEGAPQLSSEMGEVDEEEEDFSFKCEPDVQARIVAAMRAEHGGLDIRDRRLRLVLYTRCFLGSDFVAWIRAHSELTSCSSKEDALDLGNEMLRGGLFDHVKSQYDLEDRDLFYRFADDDPRGARALNVMEEGTVACQPQSAGELGKHLRTTILRLYDEFLSEDGTQVDYEGIAGSVLFTEYRETAARLTRVNLNVPHEERAAFFINVYNALVIHKMAVEGRPVSLWQRYKFFTRPGYIISGQPYSLNDIENGILRANKPPPMSSTRQFSRIDPRSRFALRKVDPRVHFALVCGARSCPPIQTYDSENLDEALTCAAQAFFEGDGILLDEARGEVSVTRICKWYRSDFGEDDLDVVGWIVSFLEGEKRAACIRM